MTKFPNINEQMDIISNGSEEIIVIDELEKILSKSLSKKEPINIKFGCDPSMPDLHLGHSVVLKKLKQFQDFGHNCTLVIGDFTAMIGDPTGKNKTRPQLTEEQAKENAATYIDQASLILDISKLNIANNSSWLNKLNFSDLINLSSKYSVARMLERDDFSKRYSTGNSISLHEFLYPLAQAYDSVFLNSHVELGGTDQKFNLLVARDIQRAYNLYPQCIITMPILEGTDGKNKMSKSYDNYIGLTDNPNNMFGKILSIPDTLIIKYYKLLTNLDDKRMKDIDSQYMSGMINPRDLKRNLAIEIVSSIYNLEIAKEAQKDFDNLFVHKNNPIDIPEYKLSDKNELILSIMKKNNLITSNSEGKRLILQGAVAIDGEKISDFNLKLKNIPKQQILKVGKRRFLKIIIN